MNQFVQDYTFYKTISLMGIYFQSPIGKGLIGKNKKDLVEIKTPVDCGDDFIKKSIPYPTSRFSKYSRGLLISQRQLGEF